MKKLMFVAAAVAASVAVAEGITSANIVGYMSNALDSEFGSKAMVVPFANVGATAGEFKLSDITPKAIDIVSAEDLIGAISFQLLNGAGETIDGSDRVWDGEKWATFEGEDKSDETYAPGAGIWMSNSSYDPDTWECGVVDLQSAGEVIQENVIADMDGEFGSVFVGNPFPTALKLSDIIPYTTDGAAPADVISFQKLNGAGETIENSDRVWNGEKWVTFEGEDASDETLAPGEGIWLSNSNYDPDTWECIPGKVRFVAPAL